MLKILLLVTMVLFMVAPVALADSKKYGLQALNDAPINHRIPLILVHGINPQLKIQYGWMGFIEHVKNNPAFNERYKLYLFVFNPADSVAKNSQDLQVALRDFLEHHPERLVRFAALSLGGLLVQNAMQDEEIRNRTDRVIGIGVPFHGTPLANPEWIRAQLKEQFLLSPMRLSNRMVYWLTAQRFPTFQQDYCWDNFDGSMPEALAAQGPTCPQRATLGEEKYILYAGYFRADPEARAWLVNALDPSANPNGTKEKRSRLGRHGLFPYVQSSIAGLPLNGHSSKTVPEEHPFYPMTYFNDGISPISSQLWLGRFVHGTPSNPVPLFSKWQSVFQLSGTQKARLFENLDHRDWLEGNTRISDTGELKDLLHPDLEKRDIFQWLEYDLMRE